MPISTNLISFFLCPLRRYLRGGHRLTMVAPRTALVIDDIGDFDIVERGGKWGHYAAINDTTDPCVVQALQHHLNVFRGVVLVDDGIVLERRERTRQAFTVGLMAGRTVRREQSTTF